jgi:two-component system response regulator HydG
MAEILLIDDMRGVRRAVSSVLKGRGHVVTEADDGSKGVDLLKSGQRFDLVITDVLMPVADGTEVIMYVNEMPKRPAVIAISGGGSEVSTDTALMLAKTMADGVLAKPFDNADLVTMVDRLLTKN